jgi:hypothetical protein
MGTKHFFCALPRAKFGILELFNPGQSSIQPAGN